MQVPEVDTYSWLEPYVPREFKDRVHDYITEANFKVEKFLKNEQTIEEPDQRAITQSRPGRPRGNSLFIRIAVERIIIQALANGDGTLDIAIKFGVTREAMNQRIKMIRNRYNAKTNVHLIAKAIRAGFIE